MAALLFLLILGAGFVALRSRRPVPVIVAYVIVVVGVALLFAHHATDVLDVNL